ncbi:DUF1109 domain-containing protein [Paraburkholderia sp. SEWSISQ10-3 4]|uniref:DUF1109 domain-containing protein n=1 Tax=Paraburkholderia TaxID=1822464 RepID=UPI00225C0602|nr:MULTISPECIES: DUF1109 domain-containing protein [Paraburkholderia]MCX4138272.1 DUF1109 domain-containing protein [Paraburkholderia aspalathi]MDN7170962.1 DUF1109 domain-containing protein [Paraburkholderia sp. SEWSISQ10-3 4]MDQ6500601.1 DUF1109 domain-containing protein [Paraburkholderia aspalathi]
MRTDELVGLLSTGITPVKSGTVARRFGISLPVAALGATALMAAVFGIRPDLSTIAKTAIFWEKLAFPLCLAIGALIATVRLARPGAKVGTGWPVIAIPVVIVWIAAIAVLVSAAPQERLPAILGQTWRTCPFNILLLAVPGFIAIFWAVKGLAPTRLRLAGAISGLLASSVATVAYCFHCPEMNPAFWSIWYVVGMLLPVALGAVLGPKLLRW